MCSSDLIPCVRTRCSSVHFGLQLFGVGISVYQAVLQFPYTLEETTADLGYEGRLYQTAWPEFDEEKTVEAVAEIAVQINGKMRGTIKIAKDADKETAIAAAKEAVADKLTGNIVKEIFVPGRIVNIVQK